MGDSGRENIEIKSCHCWQHTLVKMHVRKQDQNDEMHDEEYQKQNFGSMLPVKMHTGKKNR